MINRKEFLLSFLSLLSLPLLSFSKKNEKTNPSVNLGDSKKEKDYYYYL